MVPIQAPASERIGPPRDRDSRSWALGGEDLADLDGHPRLGTEGPASGQINPPRDRVVTDGPASGLAFMGAGRGHQMAPRQAPASGRIGPPRDREARLGTDGPASEWIGPPRYRQARLGTGPRVHGRWAGRISRIYPCRSLKWRWGQNRPQRGPRLLHMSYGTGVPH